MTKHRLHVVALPHSDVSDSFTSCAFNQKVLKFVNMMVDRGHQVFLYSSENTTANPTEHVACITEDERLASLKGRHYTQASFDYTLPHWQKFNNKVIDGINKRKQPKDFICVIGGLAHKQVANALPDLMTVEFGIGYGGVFADYKVFESYAWMHTIYGALAGSADAADGKFFDTVIPNYFALDEFPYHDSKKDYYLYIGRITDRKGWRIAQEVCQILNKRLVVAGAGDFNGYGEYVGVVDSKQRGELMSNAIATFVPTIYIEPFAGVHIESILCGTPIISTDWGVFTETIVNGENGYRCRTFQEFIDASILLEKMPSRKRLKIRNMAQIKYGTNAIAKEYEDYFSKLLTLYRKGWYELDDRKNMSK